MALRLQYFRTAQICMNSMRCISSGARAFPQAALAPFFGPEGEGIGEPARLVSVREGEQRATAIRPTDSRGKLRARPTILRPSRIT